MERTWISSGNVVSCARNLGWHVLRQSGDRSRQLAGHFRIGERRAQTEEPEPGGRDALGSDAAQAGLPWAGHDVYGWSSTTTDATEAGGEVGVVSIRRTGDGSPPIERRPGRCRPPGGRRITASPKSTTVTRPP